MTLTTEIARTLDELEVHAEAWNRLALQAPQQHPMLSHAWIASFFQHRVKTDESWLCVFALEGNSLLGVLPLIVEPYRALGLNRPKLRTPVDNHTICVDMVARRGHEDTVLPRLIQAAMNEYPNLFSLELRRLPEASPTFAFLSNLRNNFSVIKEFDGIGDFLTVSEDIETYWDQLSSNLKRNLRKAKNRLKALVDEPPSIHLHASSQDIWLSLFMEIEASGWKGEGGSALLNSQSLVDFYTSLTRRLDNAGWLEWQFLRADDKTFAGNLAIKFGRSLVLWKVGYDSSYAKCAPGSLLFEEVVRLAFDSKAIEEINLLSDMPWHKQWKTSARDYYNFYLFPAKPIPWLLGALPRMLLNGLRRVPGLRSLYNALAAMRKKLGLS